MDTSENLPETDDRLAKRRTDRTRAPRDEVARSDSDGRMPDLADVAADEAGHGVGVEVAASEVCPQWDHEAPLVLRLLRVQSEVATLALDVDVQSKTFSYKGISSAQIVQRAKEILVRHGILFWPKVDKDDARVNGNMTSVYVQGYFYSVDDPQDHFVFGAWGSDTDNAGKGYMKALTNATKQVLAKALMMSTVEEAEQETKSVEHQPEGASEAVRNAERLTEQAIRSWGDAYKAALDGVTTLPDLKRIRSENAWMMKHADVPQVTKDYFIDKIIEIEQRLT